MRWSNRFSYVLSTSHHPNLLNTTFFPLCATIHVSTTWLLCDSTYVSVPSDFGGLSVDSFISGIIAGILEGSAFPARVTAHSVTLEDGEVIPQSAGGGIAGSTNTSTSGVGGTGSSGGPTNTNLSYGTSSSSSVYYATYSVSELTGLPLLPMRREKTVFLVKFAQSVLARDSSMG